MEQPNRYSEEELQLPELAMDFVGLRNYEGVKTYLLRGNLTEEIDQVVWLGYFDNLYNKGQGFVAAGLIGDNRIPSQFFKSIIRGINLPESPEKIEAFFTFGDKTDVTEAFSEKMPSSVMLVGFSGELERFVVLRSRTNLSVQEAFDHIRLGLEQYP